jgi:hypothetical protein
MTGLLWRTDGEPEVVQLNDVQRSARIAWIENEKTGLAATLFPALEEVSLRAISERECALLEAVEPSAPSYTVGCPYGIADLDPSRPLPLVLDGVVSGVSMAEGLIYTSAPIFPGNLGGPLLMRRSRYRSGPGGGFELGGDEVQFAGIILGLLSAPADRQPSTPHLNLGSARSADSVLELLRSSEALEQVARVRATKRGRRTE